MLSLLKARYASLDLRSLGAFRIALGLVILVDLLRRAPELSSHYSNVGWLQNHVVLFRPPSQHLLSVYLVASTVTQVWIVFALHVAAAAAFLVGFRTRVAQIALLVFTISLNSRNVLLENGGMVVLNLLLVWSLFMPLGARFSWDSRHVAVRARQVAPFTSLASVALLLQWVAIYFFNTVQKTGDTWKQGTAVYYFLQQDRMVTALGAAVRDWIPLSFGQALSWGALVLEGCIAILLIAPFAQARARAAAWGLGCLLHLTIALLVELGPFSWAMMAGFVALQPAQSWRGLEARFGRRAPETKIGRWLWQQMRPTSELTSTDPPGIERFSSRLKVLGREACVLPLVIVAGWQLLLENAAVPDFLKWKQPTWVQGMVLAPRMFQGWSMFAPNPPEEDGKIVAVAHTAGGRRIDPFTGRAPDFDLQPAGGFGMSQQWGDFHRRLAEPRFAGYLVGVEDYLRRYPERTGRSEDRLVSLELFYVWETIPVPGRPHQPPRRRVLKPPSRALPGLLRAPLAFP